MESSWSPRGVLVDSWSPRGVLVESSWLSERRGPTRGLVDQKSLVDSSWTTLLVDSWTRGLILVDSSSWTLVDSRGVLVN